MQIRTWEPSDIDIFNIHLCNGAEIERAPASIGIGPTPFQPVSKNAIGYNPEQICRSISAPITIKQYDFDTYIIAPADGNVTLLDGYDGQKVSFYKQGVSNTNLLSSSLINGNGTYPLSSGKVVTLIFSAELGTWIVHSES